MDRSAMRRAAVGASVVGAAGIAVAGFLPWLRSGRVLRDSFEVVRVADHLELADGVGQQVAVGAWYLLPTLCALVLVGAATRRPVVVTVAGLGAGLLALMAAIAALAAPFPAQAGPWVALGAGALTVTGSIATGWLARGRPSGPRSRRPLR